MSSAGWPNRSGLSSASSALLTALSADWFDVSGSALYALDNTLVSPFLESDCANLNEFIASAVSANAPAVLTSAVTGGVIRFDSTTAVGGISRLYNWYSGSPTPVVANLRTGHVGIAIRFRGVANPAAGTSEHRYINLTDGLTTGIDFGILRDVSTGFYSLRVHSTGVATNVPIDTAWHTAIFRTDGTNVYVYFDGSTTPAATVAQSNIVGTPAGYFLAWAIRGDTATAMQFDFDKVKIVTPLAA